MEYINRLRYKGTIPTLATSSGLVNNAVYDDMGIIGDPEPPTPTGTTYSIIETAGGHGAVVANPSGPLASGTSVSLSCIPSEGYEFVNMVISMGEFSATATTLPYVINSVTADIYVTVNCVPIATTYSLIMTQTSGGTISAPQTTGFTSGDTIVVTATASSGYTFNQWNTSGAIGQINNDNVCTLTFGESDITIYAEFIALPQTCNVTINSATGGTISATCDGQTLTNGSVVDFQDTIELNATAYTGYEFTEWQITIGSESFNTSSNPTWITANGDVTITPVYTAAAPANYNVTIVTPTGGTVTASPSGTVSAGTQVTFTATPVHNGQTTSYNFDHWSITVGQTTTTGTTNPITVTATGDVTCQATFIKATLLQLYQTDGDGTTQYLSATGTFNGDTYTMRTYDGNVTNDITEFWPSGTQVTVEYHGSDMMDWNYTQWDDSGNMSQGTLTNPNTFTLTGRQFSCYGMYDRPMPPEQYYTISVQADPDWSPDIHVSGGGTYMEFDTVTLTTSTDDPMAWIFQGWYAASDTGRTNCLEYSTTYETMADNDKSFVAVWEPYQQPIFMTHDFSLAIAPEAGMGSVSISMTQNGESASAVVTADTRNAAYQFDDYTNVTLQANASGDNTFSNFLIYYNCNNPLDPNDGYSGYDEIFTSSYTISDQAGNMYITANFNYPMMPPEELPE